MKKPAIFAAFAALALLAAGCSDEGGSSGNSPYSKQCDQHLNGVIKCLKGLKLSDEAPIKKLISCYQTMRSQIHSLEALLTEEQQNKKREQLNRSEDTQKFQRCLMVSPPPVTSKIIKIEEEAASDTAPDRQKNRSLRVYKGLTMEMAAAIINICGASSAEKARKIFCSQP